MRRPFRTFVVIAFFASAATSPAAAVQTDSVLPVCAPTFSEADWFGGTPTTRMAKVTGAPGETIGIDDVYVGRGTLSDCASQLYGTFGTNFVFLGFASPLITVSNSVIDAAGGDEQTVTISVPGATSVFWPVCYPYQGGGSVTCPDTSGPISNYGKMLSRPRAPTGFFDGLWTASWTSTTPGFQLQQVGTPCAFSATSCTYTVRFARDLTNLPLKLGDKQVLLQLPYLIGPQNNDVKSAIPLLMVVSGGGAQPAPNQDPTTGPATSGGGPSAAGGTPEPPVTKPATVTRCVVPTVRGQTLAQAKRRLTAAHCRTGTITQRSSRTVKKGRVISASLTAGLQRATGTKVALVVSRGAPAKRAAKRR